MRKVHSKILIGVLILGLISGMSVPATGGVTWPDTPPAAQMKAYLKALNANDKTTWNDYASSDIWQKGSNSDDIKKRMDMFEMLTSDLGGVDPVKITETTDTKITVAARALNPAGPFEFVNFSIETETEPPYKIAGLSVRPGENPVDDLPEGKMSDAEIVKYLKTYIDELVIKDKFSGTVLLAKDGQVLFKNAYGMACKRYDVPNKIDTKFNLGSMNKMFTGVAVAQLAEQRKLSFDDFIINHLPDYPNREVAEKVTIHQLLTHTSGMGSYWDELFEVPFWEIKTVQQLADLFIDKPLMFEPGERFEYSNSGPIILGLIIEKVSGMSYYDYVREYIYKPAGMINSDCFEVDHPVKNLAIGYTKSDYSGRHTDEWYNNLFMHAVKGGPAGGGYSTVEDLLKFDRALRSYRLLSKKYTDLVITGKVDMGPDVKYAYLIGDRTENGHRIVGHSGGAPGINANLSIFWDLGYTVAVMSNYDMGAEPVSQKLKKMLTR